MYVEVELERYHHSVPAQLPKTINLEIGEEVAHLLDFPALALYIETSAGS